MKPQILARLLAGLSLCLLPVASPALAETRIRLMASNLTSGSNQKYEGPGTRILDGLNADIVMMQEFNYGSNSSADLSAFVSSTFGSGYTYYREGNANIPNGIVSRYPILSSGEWDDTLMSDRDFAWAQIDIPGDRDLWAVSVHFSSKSSSNRSTEAKNLVKYIQGKGIPADDYLVIAGDLNTGSRGEGCISTLSQVVNTSSPYPVDQSGDADTNADRSKPYDWVMVNNNLKQYETAVAIGSNAFANGLVFDSRKYSPLSDVYPVQSSDSGASGMQHMGVVRDFYVPDTSTGGGGGTTTLTEVLITEVMYAPPSGSGPEWIELYNPTSSAISLDGWLLTDNEGVDLAEGEYWFPTGTVIGAGDYLVVAAASASYVDIVWATGGPALANSGDDVWLTLDAEHDGLFIGADLIDGFSYASSWGGYANGKSLSRTCLDCDPGLSSSWTSSLATGGTPGSLNDTLP